MYKVFLNDRLIRMEAPDEITNNQTTVSLDAPATKKEMQGWFNRFKESDLPEVVLLHSDPFRCFEVFQSIFCNIRAAGGVVRRGGCLLFIFRRGKWDLPKGKIDPGEKPREAALREVAEECGITGHAIVRPLPATFHVYPALRPEKRDEWIFKETCWFEMKYHGRSEGKPQTAEDITEVKWIPQTGLDPVFSNTFENLKQIIALYRA